MNCEGCEEGAYVIDKLAKLLAEIAIIVNGPEPPLTRWSYHDLPEKVRALKQAQQPAALAVPAVDKARFESAPCYLCGYNGPGYYQPSQHPCAAGYHAQQPAAREGES